MTPLSPDTKQHVQEHLTVGPFSISAGLDTRMPSHPHHAHGRKKVYELTECLNDKTKEHDISFLWSKHLDVQKPS